MDSPQEPDMTGRTALVTGGSSGIGKEIARGLSRLGATVVLTSRDAARAEAAAVEIAADGGPGEALAMSLDVADPDSVAAFARAFRARHPELHVLVNNAGAWFTERKLSPGGHELTLATNVLGPFLVAEALLDSLRAAGDARIVNVVSAFAGNYDAGDLEFSRRRFSGFKAYAQSKQALRMLTWGLADRLAGTGVTVNAAAPGFVRTGFNRNARGFTAFMIGISAKLFAVSPQRGAETPLWVATAPELEGITGRYFDGRKEKDGKFHDPEAIAELERICRRMTSQPPRKSAATARGESR